MIPAIVAQAPSRESHLSRDDCPLRGRCGDRLARLAGLASFDDLASLFILSNLLREWPGKAGKGDRFPMAEARAAAERTAMFLAEESVERVLLLGSNVAGAFGMAGAPYLRWLRPTTGEPGLRDDMPGPPKPARRAECFGRGLWLVPGPMQLHVWPDARYAVFPHPSGVSRWWNDPRNEREARAFLRALLTTAGRRG